MITGASGRDAGLPAVPAWVSDDVGVSERMLTLTYRVAVSLGRSRRERARLCRRIVAEPPDVRERHPDTGETDSGRTVRARIVAALRSELGPRVERNRLDAALLDAVLLDELTLLPPRQRLVLWASALARDTITDIAARTGWPPPQVARLLTSALRTVAARTTLT